MRRNVGRALAPVCLPPRNANVIHRRACGHANRPCIARIAANVLEHTCSNASSTMTGLRLPVVPKGECQSRGQNVNLNAICYRSSVSSLCECDASQASPDRQALPDRDQANLTKHRASLGQALPDPCAYRVRHRLTDFLSYIHMPFLARSCPL